MKRDDREIQESRYFEYRNVRPNSNAPFIIPYYIREILPTSKEDRILDIGCGFGQFLQALKNEGFNNIQGIDISDEAVAFGKKEKIIINKITKITEYKAVNRFDFFIMSHVLEHLGKNEIISTLEYIRLNLLKKSGSGVVIVPNAQSNTGCYWAYEDFTHTTLFTTGSLYYVLRSAGFDHVEFLDPLGTEGARPLIKLIKKIALSLYKINRTFWNRVTSSSYHKASPEIYTYDLKAYMK